jgi:hypothetical protein
MARTMVLNKDINGNVTYGIPFPIPKEGGLAFSVILAQGVEQTLTVPANCNLAVFSFTPIGVWVSNSLNVLSLPVAVFSATEGVLNPAVREVKPGDTLRFISGSASAVGITFWDVAG